MESIKETDLNLQREKVTSVANTWLVKAVNPTTGEEKMIDVSNFSSVVAGQIGTNNINKLSLLPANSFGNDRNYASSTLVFKVPTDKIFTVSFIIASSLATGNASEIYVASISRSSSGILLATLKALLPGTSLKLKYKINSDKSVDVVKYRSQYSPVVGCLILSGNRYVTNLMTDISDSEIDDTFIDFTEVE